ncbi:hypothetical protein N8I77_000238 [Diaporthe amygdali]|uniref:Uncharacterized protein n=1 Tax=Phomopsis amygdali TaxID=1214568 RepID=A0AAD9SP67_PHOAM|nr:hypothetical protein N8I77_000238 [Diaporthe amygdali]
MKSQPDQKNGKDFRFRDFSEWNEDERVAVQVPKTVRRHMVIVLESSRNTKGYVKILTIKSSQHQPNIDANFFIPIAPSPKNHSIDKQLKFAGVGVTWGGIVTYRLHKLSYVRVDKVFEVPMSVLEPCHWKDEHIRLQNTSWRSLVAHMKKLEQNPA